MVTLILLIAALVNLIIFGWVFGYTLGKHVAGAFMCLIGIEIIYQNSDGENYETYDSFTFKGKEAWFFLKEIDRLRYEQKLKVREELG